MTTHRKKGKLKKHRHKWELVNDGCPCCGAGEFYCLVEGCFAYKLVDGDGKSTIDEG